MAQPHPQHSPPPYQSPHGTPPISHQQGPYPPPPKRQRMSPTPTIPQQPYLNTSPQMTNGAIPNTGFQQPYFTQAQNGYSLPQSNGYHPRPHLEGPQTPTTSMGPPLRPPEEKPADLNDLSDVLHSTGIDLKSEEAALVQRNYDAQHGSQQHGSQSFATLNSSFNSAGSSSSQPGYFDSSPYLSQNSQGDRSSFYGAGTFNQPAITPEALEEQAKQVRREAIRKRCHALQYELVDPFLVGKKLYAMILEKTKKNQIRLPDGQPVQPAQANQHPSYRQGYVVPGSSTAMTLAGETAKVLLPSNGSLSDIASLLSLAAKDRVRCLVEDSAALARGRRTSSHGVVPVDLVDLATGQGTSTETMVAVSPKTNSLKRSFSEANSLPTPVSDNQDTKTIAFPNPLIITIAKQLEAHAKLEEERSERRNKRRASFMLPGETPSRTASVSGFMGPATPGTPGERAPEAPVGKKGVSKKEQKRQADAKASEAQQHAATSSSLNMALGTVGNLFGGKKISWIKSNKPTNTGFVPPPRMNTSSQKTAATATTGNKVQKELKFGGFREDREEGAGIQIRDVVATLESDMKERRSLSKGYNRQERLSTKS